MDLGLAGTSYHPSSITVRSAVPASGTVRVNNVHLFCLRPSDLAPANWPVIQKSSQPSYSPPMPFIKTTPSLRGQRQPTLLYPARCVKCPTDAAPHVDQNHACPTPAVLAGTTFSQLPHSYAHTHSSPSPYLLIHVARFQDTAASDSLERLPRQWRKYTLRI
jgi:hypothetical protein